MFITTKWNYLYFRIYELIVMDFIDNIINLGKINDSKTIQVKNFNIGDIIQFDNDKTYNCIRLQIHEIFDNYIIFIDMKKFIRINIMKKTLVNANWHYGTWFEYLFLQKMNI